MSLYSLLSIPEPLADIYGADGEGLQFYGEGDEAREFMRWERGMSLNREAYVKSDRTRHFFVISPHEILPAPIL
jgi:hypothetical protein